MAEIPGISSVRELVENIDNRRLIPFSTGSRPVVYEKPLYNVSGSSEDPPAVEGYEGDSWIEILRGWGLGGKDCYVTNVKPGPGKGASHPKGVIGGHMTINKDGSVPHGGNSYLMPLCSWHNHTRRNGEAFEHTETKMVLLSGYMLGELASTFQARGHVSNPDELTHGVAYFDALDQNWKHLQLTKDQALKIGSKDSIFRGNEPSAHVLFERENTEDQLHSVKETNLPQEKEIRS